MVKMVKKTGGITMKNISYLVKCLLQVIDKIG
jgi:hypothetical protein